MNFFSDWTNSTLSCLFLNELSLKCLLELIKLRSTCFPTTHIQSVKAIIGFENKRFEHFIEELCIFGIKRWCLDWVENWGLLIDFSVFEELFFRDLDPLWVENKESFLNWCDCHITIMKLTLINGFIIPECLDHSLRKVEISW